MYPILEQRGLELWFWSKWSGDVSEMVFMDLLKPCPQDQMWPYCAFCGKFHMPSHGGPGSHRAGKEHNRAIWNHGVNGEIYENYMIECVVHYATDVSRRSRQPGARWAD